TSKIRSSPWNSTTGATRPSWSSPTKSSRTPKSAGSTSTAGTAASASSLDTFRKGALHENGPIGFDPLCGSSRVRGGSPCRAGHEPGMGKDEVSGRPVGRHHEPRRHEHAGQGLLRDRFGRDVVDGTADGARPEPRDDHHVLPGRVAGDDDPLLLGGKSAAHAGGSGEARLGRQLAMWQVETWPSMWQVET